MVEPIQSNDQFPDELAPGTQLLSGQYTIIRFLNSGGFGITYLAKDSLERTVVIKECFPEAICRRNQTAVRPRSHSHTSSYEALVRSFEKEARNQSKLLHPNIAGVHQVFRDNETAYMAIDFIEGKDLLDTIEERKTIPPEEVEQLLRTTLDAIGFIHSQGMLHRDISPDNILIRSDGEPVVIDFGAARESAAKSDRAMSMLRVVKEGYSPQEFYLQGGEQDQSSDLYALAATFYHVIKGNAPQDSQTRLAGLAQSGQDPYQPLEGTVEGYSTTLLRSIDRALRIPPEDRFRSVQEWNDALDGKMPVEAAATPEKSTEISDTIAVNKETPRRSGKPIALMALIAVGVLGGVGYYLAQPKGSSQSAAVTTEVASVEKATEESEVPAKFQAEQSVTETEEAATSEQPRSDVSWVSSTGQAIDLPFSTVTTKQPEGSFSMVTLVRANLGQEETEWLKSGTIIYSVNGNLVVDDDSILRAILSNSDLAAGSDNLVKFRVRTVPDSPITEHSMTIQTGTVLALSNGVQFNTVGIGDGKWITKISRSPSSVSSVRVGDVIVSEKTTKIAVEGQQDIEQVFAMLSDDGAESAQLTIARNGELKAVELPLNP